MKQPPPGKQTDGEKAEVTKRLEFLLATRIRYELHQRARATPAPRAAEPDSELERTDPEQALRAAEFLLATRALREVNERAIRPYQGPSPEAPDPSPR